MNNPSDADKRALKLKPKKEENKEISFYEREADFVCNTIRKCIITEPEVVKQKSINVYRKLSTEAIDLLSEVDLRVKTNKEPVSGVYHIITWESLESIGVK